MNFFHRKKADSNNEFPGRIRKLKREEHLNLPNLPKEILVCDESGQSEQEAFSKFVKSIKAVSIDLLDSALKDKTQGWSLLRRNKKQE
jgi:hypothetical protein